MSCLLMLFAFMQAQLINPNLHSGWLLGEGKTWAYTFSFSDEAKEVHYWAFGHKPTDSKVKMRLVGVCMSEGKEYPVFKADFLDGVAYVH